MFKNLIDPFRPKFVKNLMTVKEKKKLVRNICNEMKSQLLTRVSRTPGTWMGAEIRWWLIDFAHCFNISGSLKRRRAYLKDLRNRLP